jgi:hypothetical protein
MKAQVLTGSKSEIAAAVASFKGEIREVIIFVDEPADAVSSLSAEDIFAEMEAYTVKVGGADYSRDTLYTRLDGE